jgi:PKD repeat protein
MILKKFIFTIALLLNLFVNAQENKTVTLTVSGSGKTLEESKTNALRSAIEQAFGAFISSKTEILNDDFIKDEIVSITNGNIEKFEIISKVELPDGGYAISINATVSISKLTSFAQSKGVSIEVKGDLFAANIIQQKLDEKAELIALKNIINVSNELLKKSFDYSIITNENPIATSNNSENFIIPLIVKVQLNNNYTKFCDYFFSSLNQISLSKIEAENNKKIGKENDVLIYIDKQGELCTLFFRNNESFTELNNFVFSIYKSLLNFNISDGKKNIDGLIPDKVNDIFRIFLNGTGHDIYNASFGETSLITNINSFDLGKPYSNDKYFNYHFKKNIDISKCLKPLQRRPYSQYTTNRFKLNKLNKIEWYKFSINKIGYVNFYDFNFYLTFLKRESKDACPIINYKDANIIAILYFNDYKNLEEIKQLTKYSIIPKN